MRRTIRVYEVEHAGDEQRALDQLAARGCRDMVVVARDYTDKAIAVSADAPPGLSSEIVLTL
jgi:hypothetical protein